MADLQLVCTGKKTEEGVKRSTSCSAACSHIEKRLDKLELGSTGLCSSSVVKVWNELLTTQCGIRVGWAFAE